MHALIKSPAFGLCISPWLLWIWISNLLQWMNLSPLPLPSLPASSPGSALSVSTESRVSVFVLICSPEETKRPGGIVTPGTPRPSAGLPVHTAPDPGGVGIRGPCVPAALSARLLHTTLFLRAASDAGHGWIQGPLAGPGPSVPGNSSGGRWESGWSTARSSESEGPRLLHSTTNLLVNPGGWYTGSPKNTSYPVYEHVHVASYLLCPLLFPWFLSPTSLSTDEPVERLADASWCSFCFPVQTFLLGSGSDERPTQGLKKNMSFVEICADSLKSPVTRKNKGENTEIYFISWFCWNGQTNEQFTFRKSLLGPNRHIKDLEISLPSFKTFSNSIQTVLVEMCFLLNNVLWHSNVRSRSIKAGKNRVWMKDKSSSKAIFELSGENPK